MKVLITGAGGLIGTALIDRLFGADRHVLKDRSGVAVDIDKLLLADFDSRFVERHNGLRDLVDVEVAHGDLSNQGFFDRLVAFEPDAVFHLAASLTLTAEVDSTAAYAVNVAPIEVFTHALPNRPRFIFTSSIAVYGQNARRAVDERDLPAPNTTYGAHKLIAEVLLSDARRKGQLDSRILRLPIVLLRDGALTQSVSDQIAALVRDPILTQSVDCPLNLQTQFPVASATAVATALLQLHDVAAETIADPVVNFPSRSVTAGDLIEAAFAEIGVAPVVQLKPDSRLQGIVEGWPGAMNSTRAGQLGIHDTTSLEAMVREYRHRTRIA